MATHLYLVPKLRMSGAILLFPSVCLHDVEKDDYTFTSRQFIISCGC